MIIHSEQEMLDFGKKYAQKSPSVIELIGDVGAGKTTFVRGLAKGLGIRSSVTSPSFTISKSYALPNTKGYLIHYDFYRLNNPGIMQEDLHENLKNPHNIVIVEWSNSIKKTLPKNRTIINFRKNDDDSREILITNQTNDTPDQSQLTKKTSSKTPLITTAKHKRTKNNSVKLFLDTSTPTTILKINNQEYQHNFDHDLAEKLLKFIHDKLADNHLDWHSITEITFMSGPGSFTGLRIGASIVNTLTHELGIPLYDHHGKKHPIIIPDYGRPANISQPKK